MALLDRAIIKLFISWCQFLVFQVLWVAWFYFLGIKCYVILVVMHGEKTEQSLWALCLLSIVMDSYGCLRQSHSWEPDCAVAVILVHADTQMLFQAGYMSKCIHSACYCCLFLGLGSFKVLCGKDRCRNGKRTWKWVAYFPVFQCSSLFFNAGFDVWLCHWWNWGMYALNTPPGTQTDRKHKGSGTEWNMALG